MSGRGTVLDLRLRALYTDVLGWRPDVSRLPKILAGSALAVVLGALVVQLITGDETGTVASIGIVVGHLAAGVMFIRFSGLLDAQERRAWHFVGAGLGLSAVGVAGVGVTLMVQGSAPAFSVFDGLFIMAYVLMLLGLGKLPQFIGGHSKIRLYLDGAIGAVSLGALVWLWLFDEFTTGLSGAPLHEIAIALLYPTLDLATMVMVTIVIVRRSTFRFDLRLVIFGAAMISQAVADLSYAISATGKQFEEANPSYLAFLLATLGYLIASMMVAKTPARRAYADQKPPWWALVMPYGSAVLVVGALSIRLFAGDVSGTDRVLYVAALAIAGLVIMRQVMAIGENQVLVENERGALVASISHELRTPLTSVVGYLSADDGLEMVDIAWEQAKYMSDIIANLVMLSRDDPSFLDIERKATSVLELADEAARVAGSADVVRFDIPENLVAHVDVAHLRQAIVNLLDNARKYGGPLHVVKAYADKSDLIVEVHDNGSGVPMKYQLSIWERFERGHNRLNAATPGSGIGLAVASLIARAHGGNASYVQSSVLGGACFRVWLPGCVPDLDQELLESAGTPSATGSPR